MNLSRRCRSSISKRVMAVALALAIICSVVGVAPMAAEAAATYPYAYTIRNFLSDYQYVTKGDMSLVSHTVGGVVSGGDITLESFGEAMIMPSYAKHIVKAGNLNATKYEGIPSGYECNTFYYMTKEEDAVPNYHTSNFVQGEYIKVNEAFDAIYSESAKMAHDTVATPTKSGDTFVVDFSKADSYKLDASLFTKGGSDTVNIIGVDSADDFTKKEYSISFTGFGEDSVFLDYAWGASAEYDYYVHITFNGNQFEQVLKQISTDNYAGGQYVNAGMKLITNLPDATELKTNGLSGHLVAPKADVEINSGGMEGGVIANSIVANVEGHFYPYYRVGDPRDNEGNSTAEKEIVQTNVNKGSVFVDQPIVVDTIKDKNGDFVEVNSENADFQWQVKNDATGVWEDIPGATSPEYTPDESLEGAEIRCEVTGKNQYTGIVYDDSVVRALPPVQTGATEDSITIEAEEGFEYKVVDKEGNVVQDWTRDGAGTDADGNSGTITFEGLNPETEYDLLKRKNDISATESLLGPGRTITKIVVAELTPEVARIGQTVTLTYIEDVNVKSVEVNTTNATYQWQVNIGGVWTDVSGATATTFVPTEAQEGKQIRCHVTGINTYTGEAYAEGIVKAQPPVEKGKTDTTITVEAEMGFEYEVRDPQGNVVVPWTMPEGEGVITFVGLAPETEYDVVKRTPGMPVTESDPTTIQTMVGAPGVQPSATPETTLAPGGMAQPSAAPEMSASPVVDPEDPTAPFLKSGSVELKIPTIVMKKVMGPKMKFKIKLLNQKGAKVRCESTNKKLATINKKGLVKTKKKTGKCKLIINVSKGEKRIQYIVNLVVRKSCKKNYSLYKYKTSYKSPSVSLYKLVPRGKSYKIKLKHLNKSAKVVYKSNNKKVATVNKKGKVKPKKNGRADVTITVTQNGIKYRYFVVVRVTEKGIESNTSYLKVIK